MTLFGMSEQWLSPICQWKDRLKSRPPSPASRVTRALRTWSQEEHSLPLPCVQPATEPAPVPTVAAVVEAKDSVRPAEAPKAVESLEVMPAAESEGEEDPQEFHRPTWDAPGSDGVDYYEALQISPNADMETIHRVYRLMAARFHPDNPATGDTERFLLLREAYHVLTDPEQRATYDSVNTAHRRYALAVFGQPAFSDGLEGEKNRRLGILSLLYHRRRLHEDHPGISLLDLERLMAIPREHLQFSIWYLVSKEYIRISDTGSDYVLTANGVDYVENRAARNPVVRQLLAAGSGTKKSSSTQELMKQATPFIVASANRPAEKRSSKARKGTGRKRKSPPVVPEAAPARVFLQ